MDVAQVLIDGKWRAADAEGTFHAENPATGKALPLTFPISRWSDCDAALTAAAKAAVELRTIEPTKVAAFLEAYANNIEANVDAIVAAAAEETALAATPRLKDVELPRTTNQLRQAAAAVREQSWRHATLDLEKNIRSCLAPLGPVVVFGPNNFPFAFNGVSGGDFAAAIAAGITVVPIPGANAAITALSASGLPTDAFRFCGFLPPKTTQRRKFLEQLKPETCTLIFYEAPHRILEALEDIAAVMGSREVVLARELTKLHEEFARGKPADLANTLSTRGEFTILISKATVADPVDTPIEDQVTALEKQGMARMDAIKQVAKSRGLSKREVYKIVSE